MFVIAALLLLCAEPLGQTQPPPPSSERTLAAEDVVTWDGFLWRNAEGELCLGIPLIGEQLMAGAPKVVPQPLAGRLAALVAPTDDVAFWFGQALASKDPKALESAPRWLVRLRGTATVEKPHTLAQASLVAVEPIDSAWLEAWRAVFVQPDSPWSGSKDGPTASRVLREANLRAQAGALNAMLAVPRPKADALAPLGALGEGVVTSTKFRRHVEIQLQRSLVAEAALLGIEVRKETWPALPPTPQEAQRWLLDQPTREGFLAEAGRQWKGPAEELELAFYARDGVGGTGYELADLATVRDTWSPARYERVRAATREIVSR